MAHIIYYKPTKKNLYKNKVIISLFKSKNTKYIPKNHRSIHNILLAIYIQSFNYHQNSKKIWKVLRRHDI